MRLYSVSILKCARQLLNLFIKSYQKTALLIITTAITTTAFAQSHYQTLGLPENATQAEVKTAYRKLAMKYHPDRHQDNATEEKFKAVKHAYEALSRQNTVGIDADAVGVEQVDAILEKLQSKERLSSSATPQLLSKLGDVYFEIASSSNPLFLQNFQRAMIAVGHIQIEHPDEIIETLTRLDTIQDFTFGMHPDLNDRNDYLPLDQIAKATSEIISHLHFTNVNEAKSFLANLAAFTSESIPLRIGNYKQRYAPKFNPVLASALLEFGVRHNLITDAASFLSFANNYSNKILDDRQRETPLQMLVRARPEFVLSLLKSANIQQAQQIIKNVYGMNQAVAYEEWIRSGNKTGITAQEILALIQQTRIYADHWKQNSFGSDYRKQAQTILDRIHTVNLTLTADFHKLNPTKEQILSFIQLSDFNSTEYTFSRLFPNQIAPRDYKINSGFASAHRKLNDPPQAASAAISTDKTSTAAKCERLF